MKHFGMYHKSMYDLHCRFEDCRIVETQPMDVISTTNIFAVHWGPRLGDCVDNCTISATDVTWVWKHLTQGFFCQLFCVCRTQRTKDLNLLLFSTRLAKAHRFKVCLKHKV